MALGTVKSKNQKRAICLVASAGSDQAAPSGTPASTDPSSVANGVPVHVNDRDYTADTGVSFPRAPAKVSTLMASVVGAGGTVVATLTLWGYLEASGIWYEIPVNGGTAITPVALAETDTDRITFTQQFANLGHYDRIGCQVASLGGTDALVNVWLVTSEEV